MMALQKDMMVEQSRAITEAVVAMKSTLQELKMGLQTPQPPVHSPQPYTPVHTPADFSAFSCRSSYIPRRLHTLRAPVLSQHKLEIRSPAPSLTQTATQPLTHHPQTQQPRHSPTKHSLKSSQLVMGQLRHKLSKGSEGSIGRIAIALARECVFGEDVMASGKLAEESL